MTEDTNNYRGIYTSNLKIDNNDGIIEAIGPDANESITLRAKGSGTTTIGGTSGGPVKIGHSTSETTVEDNLTVAGDLTVTGTFSGGVTGLDQYGTDQSYFKINKDDSTNGIRLTSLNGDTLIVHNDGGSAPIKVLAKELYNGEPLTIQTTGSNGDINLIPHGSGNVVIGTAANNADLSVNGNITYKGSLSATGLDLNGDLDMTTQATTFNMKASTADAFILKETGSEEYVNINTTTGVMDICDTNTITDARVTIFKTAGATDHDFTVYGRSASEYFEVTADDDTHSRSGQSAIYVKGMPFYVGSSVSDKSDVEFWGATSKLHWDCDQDTLSIGDNDNGDYGILKVYGNTPDEYVHWKGNLAAGELEIAGKLTTTNKDISLAAGKALSYTASTNTVLINPDANGYLAIGCPIVHNSYNAMTSSSDAQTIVQGNDIYVNTTSGDVVLGGADVSTAVSGKTIPLYIHKTSASNTLTIEHQESGTTNDNFLFPNAQDWTVEAIGVYEFRYNAERSKWIPVQAPIRNADVETVATTNVITAAESGKTFFLSHATEFTSTLPAPAAGLEYTFIVADAPESANYLIQTNSSANIIHGSIASAEDAAGSVSCVAGGDEVNFVDAKAIIGDRVSLISDGTSWFITGTCSVQDAITVTN